MHTLKPGDRVIVLRRMLCILGRHSWRRFTPDTRLLGVCRYCKAERWGVFPAVNSIAEADALRDKET